MLTLGITAFVIVVIIGVYFVYRFRAGRKISKSMMMFAHSYDSMRGNGIVKEKSFSESLSVFKNISPFKKITESEWEEVTDMFIQIDDPKDALLRLLMVPSRKVIRFLKDPDREVIDELVAVDIKRLELLQGVARLSEVIDRKYPEH